MPELWHFRKPRIKALKLTTTDFWKRWSRLLSASIFTPKYNLHTYMFFFTETNLTNIATKIIAKI